MPRLDADQGAIAEPLSLRLPRFVVALFAIHIGLLGWCAYRHSPTATEIEQLPAGLYHLSTGRFDAAVVNPPLVRTVGAVPLIFASAHCDFRASQMPPDARPERPMGDSFVKLNGRRVFWLVTLARWVCIPFSALGNYIGTRWALERFGTASAILTAFCWTFSPWMLGHGGLVTTDVAAASIGLAAAYQFSTWARVRTMPAALASGAAIGFCLLTKFTLVIVPFVLSVWWAICCVRGRLRLSELVQFGSIVPLALLVVNAGFGFEGTNQRLSEFRFVSAMLTGKKDIRADGYGNRFSGTCLANIRIPLPRNFVLGMDIQRRDFERGLASYAMGHWKGSGWWWYYLYAIGVKTPVGIFALVALAAGSWIQGRRIDNECVLPILLGGSLLCVVSSQTGFSTHGRYLIPSLPYLYLVAASIGSKYSSMLPWMRNFVWLIAAALVAESLSVYPHSLSFFNLTVGGPKNGYLHLANSNIAWGQDLPFITSWLDRHPEVSDLKLLHYGRVSPKLAGIEFSLPTPTVRDYQMPTQATTDLPSGWYAIDVNYLAGSHDLVIDPSGELSFAVSASRQWAALQTLPEYARIGYSTIVFHLH